MGEFIILIFIGIVLYYTFKKPNESKTQDKKTTYSVLSHKIEDNKQYPPSIDESYCDVFFEYSPPVQIHIVYIDSKGETTNRTVSVGRFDGLYIAGYCSLRKRYRTFRLDRVKEIADASTGEIKKDICMYFHELYKNSGSYESDIIFDKYYELLRFIKYFVYVDFDYAEEEKIIVREIVRLLDGAKELSDDSIDALIDDVESPSLHSFRIVVGKVIKMKNLPIEIIDMVEKLAEADGKINDYEKNTIKYVKQRLIKYESNNAI